MHVGTAWPSLWHTISVQSTEAAIVNGSVVVVVLRFMTELQRIEQRWPRRRPARNRQAASDS